MKDMDEKLPFLMDAGHTTFRTTFTKRVFSGTVSYAVLRSGCHLLIPSIPMASKAEYCRGVSKV